METCSSIGVHQNIKCQNCQEDQAGDEGFCDACMYDKLSAAIETKDLPLFYRLILKVPGVSLLESASGVFWAIIVPLFFFLNFLVNLYLFVAFPFPVNAALIAVVPAVTFLVFLKIGLERFINFWNLNFVRSHLEWDVTEKAKEYVSLLKRQKKGSC